MTILFFLTIILSAISMTITLRKIYKNEEPTSQTGFSVVADGYYNEKGVWIEKCARITISPKR